MQRSYNSSQQRDDWESAITSSLTAGGDLTLTGGGADSRLNLLDGTQGRAGDDLVITQVGDTILQGLALDSSTRSSSSSFGVSLNFGAEGGGGPGVGLNASGSDYSGFGTDWTNAGLVAGTACDASNPSTDPADPCGALVINTSGDLSLIAANVHGNVTDIEVSGNLTLESKQDTYQSSGSNWGANITFNPAGIPTGLGFNSGQNSQDKAMTGLMSSITANGALDLDVTGTLDVKGAVIGSGSNDLTVDAGAITITHLQDRDNQQSSSSGFQLSQGSLPTFNAVSSRTQKTGTTYGTLGQGTYVIGGERFVNDQGATLSEDQIAYLTQNPGSTITNTPQSVLASDHYQMTQENFVENVVLDSGALDVVAGSQDYELIYTLNGQWTPTQQGLFDSAMTGTLGDTFSGDYSNAAPQINDLIAGITDGRLDAAVLGLPAGTTTDDALEYLNGLLTDASGDPLSGDDLSNSLAALLDPPSSANCWQGTDQTCEGIDGDGRLFAGGDAIIAEDGPLAGANLNIGAAQTDLDIVKQEFQLDLDLFKMAQLEENLANAQNLVKAMTVEVPPAIVDSARYAETKYREMILFGLNEEEAAAQMATPEMQNYLKTSDNILAAADYYGGLDKIPGKVKMAIASDVIEFPTDGTEPLIYQDCETMQIPVSGNPDFRGCQLVFGSHLNSGVADGTYEDVEAGQIAIVEESLAVMEATLTDGLGAEILSMSNWSLQTAFENSENLQAEYGSFQSFRNQVMEEKSIIRQYANYVSLCELGAPGETINRFLIDNKIAHTGALQEILTDSVVYRIEGDRLANNIAWNAPAADQLEQVQSDRAANALSINKSVSMFDKSKDVWDNAVSLAESVQTGNEQRAMQAKLDLANSILEHNTLTQTSFRAMVQYGLGGQDTGFSDHGNRLKGLGVPKAVFL